MTMIEAGNDLTPRAFAHNAARDSLSPQRSPVLVLRDDECIWAKRLIALSQDVRESGDWSTQNVVAGAAEQVEEVALERPSFRDLTSPVAEQPQSNNKTTEDQPLVNMAEEEVSPRFVASQRRRPYQLELDESRGATSISSAELKGLITSAQCRQQIVDSTVQTIDHIGLNSPVVAKGRKKYPRPLPIIAHPQYTHASVNTARSIPPMGNQQSHHTHHGRQTAHSAFTTGGAGEDESSLSSVPRPFTMNTRKPSINVLKKKCSKMPLLPDGLTAAAIIEVPRAATAPNLDAIDAAESQLLDEHEHVKEKRTTHARHAKTMSAPSPVLLSQPTSPVTITETRPTRPLSAGTTVTGRSVNFDDEKGEDASPSRLRISALSPTIPTPSPLPEDSPHQYGLKDTADTPSPPEIDMTKIKRRSNGIEIFNEAKTLQSAASFLNGLSNARRRAESRTRQRSATQSTTAASLISASTAVLPQNGHYMRSTQDQVSFDPPSPASMRPITPKLDDISRSLGHSNKTSGFAYAKPLSLVQLKCYRNHERLMRSGNKNYPVECAVCHQDDNATFYWTCSWCALRMCNGCRAGLRQQGMPGIWERIRMAELGAQK